MRPHPILPTLPTLLLALLAAGCDDGATGADRGACVTDDDCAATDLCFDGTCVFQGIPGEPEPGAEPEPPPPEVETPFEAFGEPAAGARFVWVASPATDTVARIDGQTREVALIEVGDEPTVVRAIPGVEAVAVLARGSDEVFRIEHADGADTVTRVPLDHHANALTVAPDGRRAFAWMDAARARPAEDVSALQEVAVIDLAAGTRTPVVVGFRPSRIAFAPDGTALVVTEDGLSIIPPDPRPGPAPIVPLAPDARRVGPREVVVSADGSHAASRAEGEPGITVVALADGVPRFVPLGAVPTDLDLLPDGRLLAMVPGRDRLVMMPFDIDPDAADPPIAEVGLRGVRLGAAAVGEDGRRALLYTTTDPVDGPGVAGLLAPESGALVFTPLRKAARGAAVDPTGRVAIVLHGRAEGEPPADDPDALIAHRHGYSVVDLDTAFVKLETTPAEPSGLTFAPAADAAFLRLSAPAARIAAVQRIDLAGLSVRTWHVGSPPEALGVLPALERAFVTQTHPTGRISFLRLDDPDAPIETVTGYALNGRIE